MSTDYTYSIATNFGNDSVNLDMTTLHNSIENDPGIVPVLSGISNEEDVVTITFESSLSAGEITTLDGIISSHVPIPVDNSFIYDAIVDKDGTGDYTTINEAVNSGAITILIRSGVYSESENIILPNNFHIIGEDKNNTVVIFGMANAGFVIDSGSSIESLGTISVTNVSNSVTGVGTTFTNLSPSDYIQIGKTFHQIQSITSDTVLTLKNVYRGPTITSESYKATTLITGSLSNISIAYSSGNLITLNKAINVAINNVGIGMGTNGIYVVDSAQILIGSSVIYNSANGINVVDSDQINLTQLVIKNNVLDGITMTNCANVVMDGLNISNSGSNGVNVVSGGENIQILDTASIYNFGAGINSSSVGKVNIQSSTLEYNNGGGLITDGGGFHSIGGCVVSKNIGSGLDLSNECTVNGCVITENTIGIDFQTVSNCCVTGCTISDNTGNGISYNSSTNECILTSCQVNNNGGTGIDILGTDNIVSLCIVKNNTTAQITDGGTGTVNVNNKV